MIVDEIPKPLITKLPDNSTEFVYQVNIIGNKIMVTSKITINMSIFLPVDYENLKLFFQMIVEKHNEFVVCRRK